MKACELYKKLDNDFDIAHLKDDWSFMSFNNYIAPGFKKHYMGVMLDNTDEIKKVYTAVFPDIAILQKLITSGQTDILLFLHHAMGYDGKAEGFPFYNIPEEYLSRLRQQRISLYVLHSPLDKNSEYSTSVCLANVLNLKVIDEFCNYEGFKVGVICTTQIKTASGLKDFVTPIIGHEVKLRAYGEDLIQEGKVAVAAGGGSYGFVAEELSKMGINILVTGFTRPLPSFEPTMEFHRIAQESGINVLGATHYTTEKYACIDMVGYFIKQGVPAEFLEGSFCLEDL